MLNCCMTFIYEYVYVIIFVVLSGAFHDRYRLWNQKAGPSFAVKTYAELFPLKEHGLSVWVSVCVWEREISNPDLQIKMATKPIIMHCTFGGAVYSN